MILSWYEQKACVILLSLLHLGIKNIRLGPSLPAFITPNVLDVLVKNFNIMPIQHAGRGFEGDFGIDGSRFTVQGSQFTDRSSTLTAPGQDRAVISKPRRGNAMKCPGQDTQYLERRRYFRSALPQVRRHRWSFSRTTPPANAAGCGHRFINPKMDFGCAAYCQFAEQCLGDLPPELVAQKEDLLKDRVAVAVKRHLKTDFKRIGRAARRARHAEQMVGAEKGRLAPVIIAAYLWDLDPADRPDAERPEARPCWKASWPRRRWSTRCAPFSTARRRPNPTWPGSMRWWPTLPPSPSWRNMASRMTTHP